MTTHSSLFQQTQAIQVSLASPPGTVMHTVAMGDRALEVMTDFKQRIPVTVNGDFAISQALGVMMHSGVRLLVLDASSRLIGLISSYDIQGEKPPALSAVDRLHPQDLQARRCPRERHHGANRQSAKSQFCRCVPRNRRRYRIDVQEHGS